ncbi:hypothetical protein CICLE_v10007725mg [Citrus x clementina]|uniref:UBC core domain-containing protein n=1 Tax=Citrus clementina TaxID=85681 RepID=V4UG63_CITCL|nr:hypothetical protein CICLE_v10007725mg [Citrus x clementina]ESR65106.1 hypothetical protein CICLE_v10007725mg [Citrus x clementina]
MDPEVIEIPPPVFQAPRRRNRKQVIDLEKDEDSSDVILLDEIVKAGRKGKAIKNDSDGSVSYQPKEDSKSSVPGSHSIINLDFYDDKHVNIDDFIDVEDYTFVQAYFDNANIPAGVEAPVPWLADPSLRKEKTANGSNLVHVNPASKSSSSLQKKVDVPSSWLHLQSAHSKNTAASQDVGSSAQNGPFHVKSSNPLWIHEKSKSNGKLSASGISTNTNYVNQFDPMVHPPGVGPSLWTHGTLAPVQNQVGSSNLFYSGMPALKDTVNYPPAVGSFMPAWHGSLQAELNSTFANYTTHPSFYDPFDTVHMSPEEPADTPSGQDFSDNKESLDEDDILRKFDLFKKFDAVEDHLDHHYASKASLKQPTNKWAKRIQEEWKILENDLPDTIFVRVYESRMDLLRAVIVGAEGTPYHDGLFFFDVFFPSSYPNVPPVCYCALFISRIILHLLDAFGLMTRIWFC